MYLNDLITEINSLEKGIKIDTKRVSMLLYADDIVLMANSARDLQAMMDCLGRWCSNWGLHVNPKKTKVMHFMPKGRQRSNFNFKIGEDPIEITDKYKYLGLWFSEKLDLKIMAEQVALSAHRALGVVISKTKEMSGMPFDCFTKLYNSLVQSILDYGSCVWGVREFDCINAVQNRAMRFFLGVQKKTPTASVLGDMGWQPQGVRQKIALCRQLSRYCKMSRDRINRCVIQWAMNSGCDNWLRKCRSWLVEMNMEYLLDFDSLFTKADLKVLELRLMAVFTEGWLIDLNRVHSCRTGLNKLRTYCCFKKQFFTEHYVKKFTVSFKDRQALARLRCGAAPIAIEQGRYSNGVYVPSDERICPVCSVGVEDEFHFLIYCNLYEDIRMDLFEKCIEINPIFGTLEPREQFYMLMSHTDFVAFTARACRKMFERRKYFLYD